jgi:hypothetical protein
LTDVNNFQRVGAEHSAGVGRRFESFAQGFIFENEGIKLLPNFPVELGVSRQKKKHRFVFCSTDPAVFVERKSHRSGTFNDPIRLTDNGELLARCRKLHHEAAKREHNALEWAPVRS